MKIFFSLLLLFCAISTSAQLSFPQGFKQIMGENGTGIEDVYTNGRYSFLTRRQPVSYDDSVWNNTKFQQQYFSAVFGFPFYRTKDSLWWGTGKVGNFYSYVVADRGGSPIELTSMYNDSGFSYYSKWLLSTIREYRRKGKIIMFPMH